MSSSTSNSDFIIKPLATSAVAVAINQFILKENDMNKSLYLGAAAGLGVAGGSFIGSMMPDINFGSQQYFGNGKGVSQRIAEIGLGTAGAFVLNSYVLKNTSFRDNYINQIGVIVVADLAGEYISDYVAGRPLAIFE
jgi:hypothetical protein